MSRDEHYSVTQPRLRSSRATSRVSCSMDQCWKTTILKQKLDMFQTKCLRIFWSNTISNVDLLCWGCMPPMRKTIRGHRLTCVPHESISRTATLRMAQAKKKTGTTEGPGARQSRKSWMSVACRQLQQQWTERCHSLHITLCKSNRQTPVH